MTESPPDAGPGMAGLRGGLLSAIFLVVVAAGALIAWLAPDGETPTASVGEPAPALALVTFDGQTFDMVDHFRRNQGPVLLNLWASWCEPCLREFPVLSRFAAETPSVTVVGVAVQDQEDAAQNFVEEMDPGFPTGWDSDGSIRDAYPTFGLPATFVIDSDGVISDLILAELTPERLESIDFGA
jgi:cytochrome c biogenesis protein CcmG/thiol:disulfide interchange protein DsbE